MEKFRSEKSDNGKWDTGNYLEKMQPERVIYFQNELNVRANWEIDFSWSLDYQLLIGM